MGTDRQDEQDVIRREKEAWRQRLKAGSIRPAETPSGVQPQVLYAPDDLGETEYLRDLGFPGQFPFTRGIYPTMYRGNLWTMREYAGFGTAEEANARYRSLLERGATGLSVAFDLPTQIGYDPDHPLATDEVGRVGVAISTVIDMEDLFAGIPLDKVSTSFTINATAAPILAMYVVAAEKQGVEPRQLAGTLQNDILKEYVARGTWTLPTEPSLRLTADVIEFCSKDVPRFNPINVCSLHYAEAGAAPAQAIAYAFAAAIAYIDHILARGLTIDSFAPRLSFNLGITCTDFFERAAAYRAARRLWAHVMRDRFQAQDPRSMMLRFYAGTGGSTLSVEEPLNNIVRVAYQAMGNALGGAQAIHACSYDEAYAIPSEQSQHVALRTQQILAYETGVTNTVDPLAGSYYVESLTNALEDAIKRTMEDLEARGGIAYAIETGHLQRQILEGAWRTQIELEQGQRVVVGVNKFPARGEKQQIELHRHDDAASIKQIQRLRRARELRNESAVQGALNDLRQDAVGHANLMPALIAATRAYASLGEMMGVLREEFGEYVQPRI